LFDKGTPRSPAQLLPSSEETCIRLEFAPDQTLFEGKARADFHALCGRMQDIAICHPATLISVRDFKTDNIRHYRYDDGLLDYMHEVEHALIGRFNDMHLYHLKHAHDAESAEAVIFTRGVGPFILHSFINGERCLDGGTHVAGFQRAWHDVLAAEDEPAEADPADVDAVDLGGDEFDGLTVLLSLKLTHVEWATSFFRHRVGGSGPEQLVNDMVKTQLPKLRAMD
jgi:DNA gyrase/topoisomerase IV subunit B